MKREGKENEEEKVTRKTKQGPSREVEKRRSMMLRFGTRLMQAPFCPFPIEPGAVTMQKLKAWLLHSLPSNSASSFPGNVGSFPEPSAKRGQA